MLDELSKALGNEPGLMVAVLLGTLGMITGILISLGCTLLTSWQRVRRTEDENALKQSMLEQGLSAEEIERVICSTSLRGGKRRVPAISIAYNEADKRRAADAG